MADETKNDRQPANDPEHYTQGAADRAHGTHGKGDAREQRLDDVVSQPATRKADVGMTSDASWGDAGSGGSTIDKLPQKNRKKEDSERGPRGGDR
jgi:hypothetical protein